MMEAWLDELIKQTCHRFPDGTMLSFEFNLRPFIALIFIGIICGSVGSLVVGNRLAFFSDALAHSAFAGVAIGIMLAIVLRFSTDNLFDLITPVMVAFGVLTGLGIVFVRAKTGQSSDTVIGVFFAGAIGLGAILLKLGSAVSRFPTDNFLFGSLIGVSTRDLLVMAVLLALTVGLLGWMYNDLVFSNFNASLALSRKLPIRLQNYLFIALLAVIVNICLSAVGALLINALLVVPAASAVNLCSNMRQLFRWSVLICLGTCLLGQWISWEYPVSIGGRGRVVHLGEGGTIVVLNVVLFFASMALGAILRGRDSRRAA
jgi:zinc transport system permease protein